MADIKITFEEVRTKASEIRTCNTNLNQALEDIKTNISNLDAQWTSDASETIRSKINGMKSKFTTYYDIIEEYAKFLDTTASTYETTEATINANAGQFE